MHRHGHTVPSDLAVGRGEHVMRMRSRPYRDDNANVSRIVGVAWDVTERRKTELSLAKERNLLKAVVLGSGPASPPASITLEPA